MPFEPPRAGIKASAPRGAAIGEDSVRPVLPDDQACCSAARGSGPGDAPPHAASAHGTGPVGAGPPPGCGCTAGWGGAPVPGWAWLVGEGLPVWHLEDGLLRSVARAEASLWLCWWMAGCISMRRPPARWSIDCGADQCG